MQITVINGPNLNLLGTRQPEVYGSDTLADLIEKLERWADSLGIEISHFQSNDESDLVKAIQRAVEDSDGVVVNPGGFSHTSVAIADAVASISIPVVEVHISDISKREEYRRVSLVGPSAVAQISGRGLVGYRDGMRHLVNRSRSPFETIRYGPDAMNVGDLRSRDTTSPLVVLVHGGFWLPQWGRDQLDSAAIDLYERGLDSLNISYRTEPPWPGSGHDLLMALSWASSRYERIALLGHSAGGFLALWSQNRHRVDLTVGLAAVTDLGLVDGVKPVASIVGAGGPSAVTSSQNTVLFHGDDDQEVSPQHSQRLSASATVHQLAGVGHFDLINPNRPHWDLVADQFGDLR